MTLVFLHIRVALFNLIEQLCVVLFYYRSLSFVLSDSLLNLRYFFQSPFRISKAYLKSKGVKNLHQYGPTPLTTLDLLAREAHLTSRDVVYELGCGVGRTNLWLAHFVGCKTVGIDNIAAFINHANRIKRWMGCQQVYFLNQDFFETNFEEATCVYLYGLLLRDVEIKALCYRLHKCQVGTKIITIGYPLSDYDSNHFTVFKHLEVSFPWGKITAFLQTRI